MKVQTFLSSCHGLILDLALEPRECTSHSFKAMFALATEWLSQWWQLTTDDQFLRCRISRRPSLKTTLPLFAFVYLASDAATLLAGDNPSWWLIADSVCFLAACAYRLSSIPTESLLVDVAAVALVTIVIGIQEVDNALTVVYQPTLGLDWIPIYQLFAALAGLHGLVAVWLWWLSAVWLAVLCLPGMRAGVSPGDYLQDIVFTSLIAAASMCIEFAMASLYHEWQAQLRCNQKLLEGATDGFGVVDCITGFVLEACEPQDAETLASPSLVGQPLQSGIDDSQSDALSKFFGTTSPSLAPVPVLVTWTKDNVEFEVKLLPFELQGSKIGFSVQMVGEVRMRSAKAPDTVLLREGDASAAPSGAMSEEAAATEAAAAAAAAVRRSRRRIKGKGRLKDGGERGSAASPVASSDDSGGGDKSNRGAPVSDAVRVLPDGAFATTAQPLLSRTSLRARCPTDNKSQSNRSRDTLSLSSWSLTISSTRGSEASTAKRRRKVITSTTGTQTPSSWHTKPPAPLTLSSFPSFTQAKAARRAKLARRTAAAVEEGRPRMPAFEATPKATRLHTLQTIARSCNVSGSGCCPKHIAWMGLQSLITDVLLQPCGKFKCFSGWQCPQCLAVHDYEDGSDVDEEEKYEDQLCVFCIDTVTPVLPSGRISPKGETDPAGSASDSISAECISGCEADLEVQQHPDEPPLSDSS
eukprot:CAMPEP_0178384034 /NCGR_PEP_ID=MMETSP0689_2-20121128/7307_1 /TAXON_ID=160604 /ORGANISM="Amphidinium massartii, Strain CS-259" /LENGTH=696 /DNA_ID=CAMNT_0020004269 /DNA_START=95 /DNA_END=2186 /DNA_ORIENTATION=+